MTQCRKYLVALGLSTVAGLWPASLAAQTGVDVPMGQGDQAANWEELVVVPDPSASLAQREAAARKDEDAAARLEHSRQLLRAAGFLEEQIDGLMGELERLDAELRRARKTWIDSNNEYGRRMAYAQRKEREAAARARDAEKAEKRLADTIASLDRPGTTRVVDRRTGRPVEPALLELQRNGYRAAQEEALKFARESREAAQAAWAKGQEALQATESLKAAIDETQGVVSELQTKVAGLEAEARQDRQDASRFRAHARGHRVQATYHDVRTWVAAKVSGIRLRYAKWMLPS